RPPMDEIIRRYGNLVAPPGEAFVYSNLGYGFLDYIISRVSGKSYSDFIRDEVFLPLGMTHSSVGPPSGPESLQANCYGTDGQLLPIYNFDTPGASAVFASVHDLIQFAMFHLKTPLPYQRAIISQRSIYEMQQMSIGTGEFLSRGQGEGYGIGWFTKRPKTGLLEIWHDGGVPGSTSVLRLYPERKICIAVLTNQYTPFAIQVADSIRKVLLHDVPEDAQTPDQTTSSFTPHRKLIGQWKGILHTYNSNLALKLEIQESGNVSALLGDQSPTALRNLRFNGGVLTGRMDAALETDDTRLCPYHLSLRLTLRDQGLNGVATAFSVPSKLVGYAFSHWVELKKVAVSGP
ncbi:MAG: beta-lactamase family protein, partial [Acidobacteria bacterium]|nr:beta-lactamase family protein [Acidobacteriota bacterium]